MSQAKVLRGVEAVTDFFFEDDPLSFHVNKGLLITLSKQEEIILRGGRGGLVAHQWLFFCSLLDRKRSIHVKLTMTIWCYGQVDVIRGCRYRKERRSGQKRLDS